MVIIVSLNSGSKTCFCDKEKTGGICERSERVYMGNIGRVVMKFFIALAGFFSIDPLFADSWQNKAQKTVKKLLSEIPLSEDHFGLWLNHGGGTVTLNETKLFIPASLSKIPTALAFLNERSMDQYFHTWIYKTGVIENGVLKGDIYLKGGGDPSFVNESMWMMVRELKRSNISKIEGQLFVDDSYFDLDHYSQGRQDRRVDRAYDAPVSALSFNWNSVAVYVRPGSKKRAPAFVHIDPDLDFIKVENRVKTTDRGKTAVQLSRVSKGREIIIKISGKIPLSSKEKTFYRSLGGDPALWTGYSFKSFLRHSGIQYKGSIEKKKVPDQADLLVEQNSWDLARILSALSKFSNNFVAEMLTKHLGKEEGKPGNIHQGLLKIKNYLKKQGWQDSEFHFVNPAGLTRDNRMRPDRLGTLLKKAIENFQLAPEFLVSLPISGTDGTLKGRMSRFMKKKVRAKTGHVAGVVGLAGYMESPKGGAPIVFVFFYNGPGRYDWKVQALFDKLLWHIYLISQAS